MKKRIVVKTVKGEELSILVERDGFSGTVTFPIVAVLNDWDEGCKYAHGKTAANAVEELLLLIDEETTQDLRYLNAFFVEPPPAREAR